MHKNKKITKPQNPKTPKPHVMLFKEVYLRVFIAENSVIYSTDIVSFDNACFYVDGGRLNQSNIEAELFASRADHLLAMNCVIIWGLVVIVSRWACQVTKLQSARVLAHPLIYIDMLLYPLCWEPSQSSLSHRVLDLVLYPLSILLLRKQLPSLEWK